MKVIAAINMTLDGFCDHTAITTADEELHQHYSDLLKTAGSILYGRITFELMEYWPTVLKEPTGIKATDEFAKTIDEIPKIVFSRTLKIVEWETARLATQTLQEEVASLKQQGNKDLLVGSPSLIVQLTNLQLIDEYQLCIHPVIVGSGLPLFKNVQRRADLTLLRSKKLNSGAVANYYKPAN